MDDFAKAAAEGWKTLYNLLSSLSIEDREKTNYSARIESSSLYLKTSYSLHCTNDNQCSSHCTVFALSEAKHQEFFETCRHTHDVHCSGENKLIQKLTYSLINIVAKMRS
jgi:hypothetical protein